MVTNSRERRIHERIDARIRVGFRSGKEFQDCYSQNLSRGGIYLETAVLPDPNANVEIVLDLPTSDTIPEKKSVAITAKVVRLMTIIVDSKPVHKVALQFIDVSPQVQVQLDALYKEFSGP